MKSKPLRARLRNTCSEAAPSGTFSMYAMCEFATCSQRYTRPSNWAWLHPPSLCGPMRTMATLNLPATTSGIWVPAAAPASQPAALDGAGLALAGGALALAAAGLALAPPDEQALKMSAPAASSDSGFRSRLAILRPLLRAITRPAGRPLTRATGMRLPRSAGPVPGCVRGSRIPARDPADRPSASGRVAFRYPSADVRTNRAAWRAARHHRAAAGCPVIHRGGARPGGLASRGARAGRLRPFHGAPYVQGNAGVSNDASPLGGRGGPGRNVQRIDGPRDDGLLRPGPGAPRGDGDAGPGRARGPAEPLRCGDRERAGCHRRGDPLVPR